MSFEHAEKMHNELAEQGIPGGDCFATSLDSMLQNKDLPDSFYYDIVAARRDKDEDRYDDLVRQQIVRNFRNDHPTFDTVMNLSVCCAPDGNPLLWGEPTDRYEAVPAELRDLIDTLPRKEWERVYGIERDETEAERLERAQDARDDAYERLGMFVIARNLILDGASLMPMSMESETATHVFAVTHNGLDDIHVINEIWTPESDPESWKPIARSPHLPLTWLCEVDHDEDALR